MSSTVNLTTESTLDLQEEKPQSTFKKLPFKDKLKHIRNVITVEPLLCCYIMPTLLGLLAVQNMSLELACRVNLRNLVDDPLQNESIPAELIDQVRNDKDLCTKLLINDRADNSTALAEIYVQRLVASMISWKTPLQSAVPAILVLFVGNYSDRHKMRKPFLIIPLIGETLSAIGFILCAINRHSWPMEAVGISEALFPSLSGGSTTLMMSMYAYVADISSIEMRTLRIGIVHITATVLSPIGLSLSGILYETIGYYGIFSISIVFYFFAFIYAIFILKEPKQPVKKDKNFCVDFFDLKYVTETFSLIVKKREGSKRLRIILLMLVFIVIIGPQYGETGVAYLYTRTRFGWDARDFSLYITYDIIIHLVGSIFAVVVLSRILKLDDLLLAALACSSKVAASFVYAFAMSVTLFYFAPVVSILSGAGSIAIRSIATKLVTENELGKVQALFGISEAVAPIIYSAIYSQLYIATVETLPGAFFLLGAVLIAPSVYIFLYMYYLQRKDTEKKEKFEEKNVFRYTGSKEL